MIYKPQSYPSLEYLQSCLYNDFGHGRTGFQGGETEKERYGFKRGHEANECVLVILSSMSMMSMYQIKPSNQLTFPFHLDMDSSEVDYVCNYTPIAKRYIQVGSGIATVPGILWHLQ